MRVFYALSLLFISSFCEAQIRLLKDINDESTHATVDALPLFNENSPVARFKGRVFFEAYTLGTGSEVFSTDGTAAGTVLLKELRTGIDGIDVQGMTVVGDHLYFSVKGVEPAGYAIYKTDGTANGTVRVASISAKTLTADSNGILYFSSSDQQHGIELWRSDGTEQGTYMLKDVNAGPESSNNWPADEHQMIAVGNTIYFTANDGVHGSALWKTDGTEEGTQMVADFAPVKFIALGEALYFYGIIADEADEMGVWKIASNGAEPVLLTGTKQVNANKEMATVNDKVLFLLYENDGSQNYYSLDKNTDQLVILRQNASMNDFPTQPQIATGDGKAFFYGINANGLSIYSSDGTAVNTTIVTGANLPNKPVIRSLTYANGKFYSHAYDGVDGSFIMLASDGVSPMTTVLPDMREMREPVGLDGKAIIFAGDREHGREPWVSDGTVAGTHLIVDINTYTGQRILELTTLNSKALFINDGADGLYKTLWTSQGTTSSTEIVKELENIGYVLGNGKLALFVGTTRNSPDDVIAQPWITDGTEAGTFPLDNVGQLEGDPYLWVGDNAYIINAANTLWKTDGTKEGTLKVIEDIDMDFSHSVALKDQLYFFAGDMRNELWKTDGNPSNTSKVIELGNHPDNMYPKNLMAGDTRFYFTLLTEEQGLEMYVSDGTAEGTHITRDIHPGNWDDYYIIHTGAVFNDVMYFGASEHFDKELWRSDGTEEGTYLIKDISVGDAGSSPGEFKVFNNEVYFSADDGVHGRELWKTDGTAEGTLLVKDIYSGSSDSAPTNLIVVNNRLFLTASDGIHGTELWSTDGTEEGTSLVGDINPGPLSAFAWASDFAALGNLLFASSDESPFGSEVWVYNSRSNQIITFDLIGDKNTSDAPFKLVATASSGLPVTFEVVSGPATISADMLTITDVGDVIVRAIQEGNENYNEAFVEQSFSVMLATGFEDESSAISIWPNPATNKIYINTTFLSASLIDMLGKSVINTDQSTIDVEHFPRGLYIVKLKTIANKTVIKKVILK